MLTTFFGAHSFGGDAVFVDRLSRALARAGHEVHIIHCLDAFESVRNGQSLRPYVPAPGVHLHPLESGVGILSPLATHQTGRPMFKAEAIRRIFDDVGPDVIHFHNMSLFGPDTFRMGRAVKLLTAHEHWLVCPLHVLWKMDNAVCDKPECAKCLLHAGKPPQWWRYTDLLDRSIRHIDALICPSGPTLEEHRRRGLRAPYVHIPYFLPHDWHGRAPDAAPAWKPPTKRPYFAAAGRLERIKGFHVAVEAMAHLPEFDFVLAGSGNDEPMMRRLAAGLPNVHFPGWLKFAELLDMYAGARAVLVPSLVYETFGYVVLEAFSLGTPVVVRNHGSLPELIRLSEGGLAYDTVEELTTAMRRIGSDQALRDRLGTSGRNALLSLWSEARHLELYLGLIEEIRAGRRPARR